MTNADIKARIEEIQAETRREKIAEIIRIQEFWTAVMTDEDAKMYDRLKASELLGKSQGAFICPEDRGQWEGKTGKGPFSSESHQ